MNDTSPLPTNTKTEVSQTLVLPSCTSDVPWSQSLSSLSHVLVQRVSLSCQSWDVCLLLLSCRHWSWFRRIKPQVSDSCVSRVVSEDEFEASRKGEASRRWVVRAVLGQEVGTNTLKCLIRHRWIQTVVISLCSVALRARRATVPNKRRQSPKVLEEEPKIKKKPGPKPGWKNKFKPKGCEGNSLTTRLSNTQPPLSYMSCLKVYFISAGWRWFVTDKHNAH